jgi:hypothetical protein
MKFQGKLLLSVILVIPGGFDARVHAVHDLHDEEEDEPDCQEEHDAAVEQARDNVARAVHDERRYHAHHDVLPVEALQVAAHRPRQRPLVPPLRGVVILIRPPVLHPYLSKSLNSPTLEIRNKTITSTNLVIP